MKLYENMQKDCVYGHYNLEAPAGYTITDPKAIPSAWYYIYQNRKILVYVDQNGPVKVQYQPPSGILICKRELGETQSKLQTWIKTDAINNGIPVSNFDSPKLDLNGEQPKATVDFNATTATYKYEYKNVDIITELFVPYDKATLVIKTTVKNKTNKPIDISVSLSMFPYINIPQMVAWDLPEWYLSVKPIKNSNALTFAAKMRSPEMDPKAERSVTYNVDYEDDARFTLDMAVHNGTGYFFSPNSVINNDELSYSFDQADTAPGWGSKQSVFSCRYNHTLNAGEAKTYTQALTIQEDTNYNQAENELERVYFNSDTYAEKVKQTQKFFNDLFTTKTITTENKLYDKFINEFSALQMYWVCSLDRGWPSSMRGTRDASQDFTGLVPLYPKWTRENIKQILSRQRTDGWYPRQFNANTRKGPHDLRYFCDGGAFLLELMYEYLTYTRDFDFLFDKVVWLDSDEENTVLDHILKTFDFYLTPLNVGEHGLCKVWYGDWWDPMDKIGTDGIGESVTVTAQMALNLKNFANLFNFLYKKGALDNEYARLADVYLARRQDFIKAMQTHAFNKKGFFNGYYNDNRKWLLSDNDPDGESRIYLVSNAWAIIGGCATDQMKKQVIDNIEKQSYSKFGYYTNSKGYPVYIDKAGRKGNGSAPNPGAYNHAQSFFARACCASARPDIAYNVTRHILPIDNERVPVEKTFAPPYAISNMYSTSANFPYRVELQFLSGTVSYVLRVVYNFFFGITYELDGLTIKPSLPSEFGNASANFKYLGKQFTLNYVKTDKKEKTVKLNGKLLETTKFYPEDNKDCPFIPDELMLNENVIEIEY